MAPNSSILPRRGSIGSWHSSRPRGVRFSSSWSSAPSPVRLLTAAETDSDGGGVRNWPSRVASRGNASEPAPAVVWEAEVELWLSAVLALLLQAALTVRQSPSNGVRRTSGAACAWLTHQSRVGHCRSLEMNAVYACQGSVTAAFLTSMLGVHVTDGPEAMSGKDSQWLYVDNRKSCVFWQCSF